MLLLIDESVTAVAISFLRGVKGIEVVCSVDTIGAGQPDTMVAAYADEIKATVVNSNAKDFAKLIARRPADGRQELRHAGRISFTCRPTREAQRLEQLMPRIWSEYRHSKKEADARLIMTINNDWYLIER